MNKVLKKAQRESGQSAVLFALMFVGLIAFVGLAVDGGQTFNERRITQNASDASVLGGVHYMAASNAPTEDGLRQKVNSIAEAHGLPDSDGVPGNAVNDNITIHYTDDEGTHLTNLATCQDGQSELPCGFIPNHAFGLEVHLKNQVDTYFLGVIGQDTLSLGAEAVAVVRGTNANAAIADNALYAFGTCTEGEKPLDLSLYYSDVIGSVHSKTYFENRGSENHYHGQVTYGEGFIDTADIPGYYEAGHGQVTTDAADPFAHIKVSDFKCSEIPAKWGVTCHDLTQYAPDYDGEVNYRLLTQKPSKDDPFLDEATGELKTGLYYAGQYPMKFGWEPHEGDEVGLNGLVTLVTSSTIKITERDVQLEGYMPQTSILPGLLMFSGYQSPDPCANFESDPLLVPINTTGNQGTRLPTVEHNPQGKYTGHTLGSLFYKGIIYAPGGRVATSGHGASYEGAIIAYSIRINGYYEFEKDGEYDCDGDSVACRPGYDPRVSALLVHDPHLFRNAPPQIFMEE